MILSEKGTFHDSRIMKKLWGKLVLHLNSWKVFYLSY